MPAVTAAEEASNLATHAVSVGHEQWQSSRSAGALFWLFWLLSEPSSSRRRRDVRRWDAPACSFSERCIRVSIELVAGVRICALKNSVRRRGGTTSVRALLLLLLLLLLPAAPLPAARLPWAE